MPAKTNKQNVKHMKAIQRALAVKAGYYDGRFSKKIIKDKKKEANKRWARNKHKTVE
ncbi:MAG: hypothetical protein RIQ89_2388 [Bacteroidota bacterium]|jgi:hypothetical protein